MDQVYDLLIRYKFQETEESTVNKRYFERGDAVILIESDEDIKIYYEGSNSSIPATANIPVTIKSVLGLLAFLELNDEQKNSIKGQINYLDLYYSEIKNKEDLTAGQLQFIHNYDLLNTSNL